MTSADPLSVPCRRRRDGNGLGTCLVYLILSRIET